VPNKPRILIVDDEPTHLKLYSWILAREGFTTSTVLVESDGVQLPQEQQFNLVLLDYRLAGTTAAKLARKIKDCWPNTRIVILSDLLWMPEDVAPLASGFIQKGDPQHLVDRLRELMNM
jgi:DNA-binding response OmpR family regulator